MKRFLTLLAIAGSMAHSVGAMELQDVKSFTYWLSNPRPALIAASGFDLAIVDHSRDGTESGMFSADEVARMQARPDGGRRIVLSYMSIGEAEDYRGYWNPDWSKNPPDWLEKENPDWEGNFKVRYWHPGWQAQIFGAPEAYLDRIIAAGFDGVYLDIVDAYWYFEEQGRKTAAAEMVGFVTALAVYARARKPGFLIVPQNAEDLLVHEAYREMIDAQAKEDLFFGLDDSDTANQKDSVDWPMKHLKMALNAGKPVLLVEYPEKRKTIEQVYAKAKQAGLKPYASVRALDRLIINRGLDPEVKGLAVRD
ncbi:MJ1477/TM1410 family putative glycoside hydrolase [Minwuia sp.]|uniref:MJ1477/TM1410 family putative glycoside hydrolase n=1 Tax=Minwuia sp. TaxID=2493630 RepID=UPI003A8F16DA